jgi:hypothetical protein
VAVGDHNADKVSDILFRNNSMGDTDSHQISNGHNAGWMDVGGSSMAYRVVT